MAKATKAKTPMVGLGPQELDTARLMEHLPWRSNDETLIVLKGQLLIEDLFLRFIVDHVGNPEELRNSRFSGDQLRQLAKCFAHGDLKSWVWVASEKLYKLRNATAHVLENPDRPKLLKDFINLVSPHMEASDRKLFNKQPRRLAFSISMLYSAMTAHLRFRRPNFLRRPIPLMAHTGLMGLRPSTPDPA